ncbi:MAG: TIGR02587 family membrane protein [Desertifilum sp.]|nr:TIGR02587 family membrane protein [Desertifilum sp.]
MPRKRKQQANAWLKELDDLVRGCSGGFLFGIPLVYTMEVWWIGSTLTPAEMLIILGLTLGIVFWLTRTEGFRRTRQHQFFAYFAESVEALALGLVCATCLLLLLQEITLFTPLNEALGKLVLESVPFSIGVGLSKAFLSGDRYASTESTENPKPARLNATLEEIGATLTGALVIAFNIAPTDEVPMLSAAATPLSLLALIAASLLISYSIVFVAGFTNQAKRRQQRGIFQRPMSETIMAYLVSLGVSLLMLLFFHKLGPNVPASLWLRYSLILGLPASIGGAAGRLAV